jgi:ABC-2 type transport system ATP-binding protein
MTGRQLLDFHGRLAGMTDAERRDRIPDVLERVGLAGRGDDRIGGFSKGMTQRIGLAQAIVHRPALVLLDEPTSALDPIGRREVRDFIRVLRTEGVAVFLNSHLLSEVEMVCDRVAIVDRGRVVAAGPLDELIGGTTELRLTLDDVDADLLELLRPFGEVADRAETTLRVVLRDGRAGADVVAAVVAAGRRVHAAVPVQRTLEDVFVGLVEGRDA